MIAAGLTQGVIDQLGDIAGQLDKEESQQESFIKNSPTATDERIELYNRTFGFWQKVAAASKVIFYGNDTKINVYELPHGTPGVEYKLEGKVTDGSNDNANLKGVVVAIVEINAATVTNAFGNYGFVNVEPGNYTLNFSLGGYVEQSTPITITQSGKLTKNASLLVG